MKIKYCLLISLLIFGLIFISINMTSAVTVTLSENDFSKSYGTYGGPFYISLTEDKARVITNYYKKIDTIKLTTKNGYSITYKNGINFNDEKMSSGYGINLIMYQHDFYSGTNFSPMTTEYKIQNAKYGPLEQIDVNFLGKSNSEKDNVKLRELGGIRDNHGYSLVVKLKTDNGIYPIANQKIYMIYKGKTYTDYTDENGVAGKYFKIKGYGKQTIKIKFNGNEYYKPKTITHTHYFIPTAVTSYNTHGPNGVSLELFNGQWKNFKNKKLANEFIKKNNKKYKKEIKFNKKHNSEG